MFWIVSSATICSCWTWLYTAVTNSCAGGSESMTCGAETFTPAIERLWIHQTGGNVKQQDDQMRTYRASIKHEP